MKVRDFLALALAVLVVAGCGARDESGPERVVQDFYRQLNEGNYGAALALYDDEVQAVLGAPGTDSASSFEEWARAETHTGRVAKVEILGLEAHESAATVEYEVIYSDGTKAARKVELKRETDGLWRLGFIG